jgi:predicted transposase YbfD/YdcC
LELSSNFTGHFEDLLDPRRSAGNHRHAFTDILSIAILGSICGADNWVELETFARGREEWLRGFLALSNGVPSHDTFGRVFAALDSDRFERCFVDWVASLPQLQNEDADEARPEIISIDGKTSRRSHNRRKGINPLHMVSAWASERGLSLGQVATAEKSNEIEAIPRLLNMIDVGGAVVTVDAMGCQQEIAAQIIERKGDYVLGLKDNQPTLADGVRAVFRHGEKIQYKKMHHLQKLEKIRDHGRVEKRRYTLISCKDAWAFDARWPGLRSIGMLEVRRTVNQEPTHSVRYFLTSLTYDRIDDFMRGVRNHWNVEINLHWSLDVSFADDLNRTRTGNAAENLSVVKRIALNLLKQEKSAKVGITAKRKKAAWDNAYLAKIMAMI